MDLGGTDDVIADDLRRGAYRHPPPLRLLLQLIEPADVVVDLGAHLGVFALAAAARGARVLAVEGNPHNAELLRANVDRNRAEGAALDVDVVSALVGDQSGDAPMLLDGAYSRVVSEEIGSYHDAVVRVPMTRLDDLLAERGIERVDVVKMDLEGAEPVALRGMAATLSLEPPPAVLAESNAHVLGLAGSSPTVLLRAFQEAGYEAWRVDDDELLAPRAGLPDVVGATDYLFLRGSQPDVAGWRTGPMRAEVLVADLASEAINLNDYERAHTAAAMGAADRAVLQDESVVRVLDALAVDPVEAVRMAARWWLERRPEAPGQLASLRVRAIASLRALRRRS